MPAVIPLVMMGVSAAAGAYTAHKGAQTAKEAAKSQENAANKGMDLERQQEQERQARLKPYVDAGYQGLYNMSNLANAPRNPMPMFNGNTPGGGWTPNAGQFNLPPGMQIGGQPQGLTYPSPIGPGRGPDSIPGMMPPPQGPPPEMPRPMPIDWMQRFKEAARNQGGR